jgi:hypothetical protein
VVEGLELGLDGLAVGLEFGEAFVAAGAHGLGGGVGRVGGQGLNLGDLGSLGQVNPRELFGQPVSLAFVLFGGLGVSGGDLLLEESAAVGAEHLVGEEVTDQVHQGVLADGDGAGVVG